MRVFTTTSLDLAAFLALNGQREAEISLPAATEKASFIFEHDERIEDEVVSYARGNAIAPAKPLLNTRAELRKRLLHLKGAISRGFTMNEKEA